MMVGRLVLRGILGVASLIAGFAAAIALLIVGVFAVSFLMNMGWERRALPKVLEISEVITSATQSGILEGCAFALYKLSPATITGIKAQGILFFGDDTHPWGEDRRNPYSEWRPTPAEDAYAAGALADCGQVEVSGQIYRSMRAAGSYYILTANEEGMVLVDPNSGLAAYLYFG